MRRRWLIAGVALAGTLPALADARVINSFDRNGRLTFPEEAGTTRYRVEWATNLLSPNWSSNAPGIAPGRLSESERLRQLVWWR